MRRRTGDSSMDGVSGGDRSRALTMAPQRPSYPAARNPRRPSQLVWPRTSERVALKEAPVTDAARGRECAPLQVVAMGEAEDAQAPRIGVAPVAELFAPGSVDADHVVDIALDGGGALGLRRAAGEEQQQQ